MSRIRRLLKLESPRRDARVDVDAELSFHFHMRIDELAGRGFTREEARREALRRFGDVERVREGLTMIDRERIGQERRAAWWSGVWQDAQYALRGIRKQPAFAIVVALTLGTGIGANATMFGIIDRLLLRPPAHVVAPEGIRRVYFTRTYPGMGTFTEETRSYPDYLDMSRVESFEQTAAYANNHFTLGRGAEAKQVRALMATAGFFPLLGVKAALGRFYSADEDRPPLGTKVAVLGHGLWTREYGADAGIIGRTLDLNSTTYTVIGVAPRGFNGLESIGIDVFIPLSSAATTVIRPDWPTSRGFVWLSIATRLRGSATDAGAGAQATTVFRQANVGTRGADPNTVVSVGSVIAARGPNGSPEAKISTWLVGVAGIVLLIACANVANLLLARATRRRREIGMRIALGIGRSRLITQLLTESALLALLGGIVALALAYVGGNFVRAVLLPDFAWDGPPLDTRVLLFTAAAAVATALLTGLAPAIQSARTDLTRALRTGSREGYRRSRLRILLLIAQAALSVTLLVGAGLFLKSLDRVLSIDLGYDSRRVLVAEIDLSSVGYKARQIAAFYDEARNRVRTIPGVAGASIAVSVPFWSSFATQLAVPGWDSLPRFKSGGPYINAVTDDFFATVGTRIVRGRGFLPSDKFGAPSVAVVNETMASRLWPGKNPLGQCLKIGADTASCSTVVGVSHDARREALKEEESVQYFVPLEQRIWGPSMRAMFVRVNGDPEAMVPVVRRAMQSLAPNLPYADVRVFQTLVDPQIRPWRLGAAMFGLFGLIALAVAAVGLYSVIAYEVTQRTHEMGVRMALGARGADLIRLVLQTGLRPAVAGVTIGLVIALAAGRTISSLLFDTSPRDPLVLALCAGVLLVVATAASLVPAWRASRVDPATALRD